MKTKPKKTTKTTAKKTVKKSIKKEAVPNAIPDSVKKLPRSLTRASINTPLQIALAAAGCTKIQKEGLQYYVNREGGYVPYPPGYIRGPVLCSNGNPRPYQMSVQGHNGWHQRGFTQLELVNGEAEAWAIKTAVEVLPEDNT